MGFSVTYEVIKTQKNFEHFGLVETYGLVKKNDQDIVATIEDISCNYQFVSYIANKLTSGHASAIHLMDIVEDELLSEVNSEVQLVYVGV